MNWLTKAFLLYYTKGNKTNTAGRVGIHACGDLTSTAQSASRVVEAGTIYDDSQ